MKILLTGSGGYLAKELIKQLCDKERYQVVAASRDPQRVRENIDINFNKDNITYVSNENLLEGAADIGDIDVLIHTAFSRKGDGRQLCESLRFSKSVFEWVAARNVTAVVNISSQSVYGSKIVALPVEDDPVCPTDLYGMAKYATELLLESIVGGMGNGKTRYTSIRLASVIGPGLYLPDQPKRIVVSMIECALSGKNIHVVGGGQKFSYLDVRDVANALLLLSGKELKRWKPAYNLGPKKQTGIMEVAEAARELAARATGKWVDIIMEDSDVELSWGVNSKLFYEGMGWKPQFTFYDSVMDLARQIVKMT